MILGSIRFDARVLSLEQNIYSTSSNSSTFTFPNKDLILDYIKDWGNHLFIIKWSLLLLLNRYYFVKTYSIYILHKFKYIFCAKITKKLNFSSTNLKHILLYRLLRVAASYGKIPDAAHIHSRNPCSQSHRLLSLDARLGRTLAHICTQANGLHSNDKPLRPCIHVLHKDLNIKNETVLHKLYKIMLCSFLRNEIK